MSIDDLGNEHHELAATVLRQGEIRLQAQLQIGLAADQRAVTFASFITPTAAVALGFAVASSASFDLRVGAGIAGLALAIGAFLSALAARPVEFRLAGNLPDRWWCDGVTGRTLAECMRRESLHYYGRIRQNRETINANASRFHAALVFATLAPFVGAAAAIVAGALGL